MGIAWSGYTQSNGSPKSLYWYEYETWGRTSTKVHVRLKLWVRMRDYSNYFSFQIAHETKVYGGGRWQNERYQWSWVKQGRGWWGHQWEGSSWLWDEWSYDYNGANWHGPYTVFDKDVPIGIDEDMIYIVPVITRPPCLYDPHNFDWSYTPWLCKANWQGYSGYWRPWSGTEYPWYWWGYDHAVDEDMAFGNNRWLEPLGNGTNIGKYPRPANVSGLRMSPTRIDVAIQDSQSITVSWSPSARAAGYRVYLNDRTSSSGWRLVSNNHTATSITFNPKQVFVGGTNWRNTELRDGQRFYVAVEAIDSAWVTSASISWVGPVTYYEVLSEAPTNCFAIGRRGVRNDIFFRGETCRIYYSGEANGSYPVQRLCLRRSDGAELWWNQSEKTGSDSLGRFVTKAIAAWARPNQDVEFELRAYNTKGREVWLKSYNQSRTGAKWFKFRIHYYGGVMYVYGKAEYDGDEAKYGRLGGSVKWNEGLARVWGKSEYFGDDAAYGRLSGGESWHESALVYVYDGKWRSL